MKVFECREMNVSSAMRKPCNSSSKMSVLLETSSVRGRILFYIN